MAEQFRYVGKNLQDESGLNKVLGRVKYSNDIRLSGMLEGKVLKCPYPKATIVEIDTAEAEAMPGVEAVLTMKNWPNVFLPDIIYCGAPVAAVFAENADIAKEALKLIRVKYKVHPFVLDGYEALKDDAPKAMPDSFVLGDAASAVTEGSVDEESQNAGLEVNFKSPNYFPIPSVKFIEYDGDRLDGNRGWKRRVDNSAAGWEGFGDLEEAYEEVDVFLEDSGYKCGFQQAPCLATAGAVAYWDGKRLDIYAPTQYAWGSTSEIPKRFGIPADSCNLINYVTGGAFGSRLDGGTWHPMQDPQYTNIAIAGSMQTGKPCRYFYTRDEEYLYYWGRGTFETTFKIGFKNDGTMVSLESDIYRNVAGLSAHTMGPITFCNAYLTLYGRNLKAVHTHKIGAMTNESPKVGWQGYGFPEVLFALEGAMDGMAEKLGMDPIELRKKNHLIAGDPFYSMYYSHSDTKWLAHSGMADCIDAGMKIVDWENRGKPEEKTGRYRHGVGMALLVQPNAGEGVDSDAMIKMHNDGSVVIISNFNDMGQGGRTACMAMVAEILGLPLEKVRFTVNHTDGHPYTSMNACSSGLETIGQAINDAARNLKKQMIEIASMVLEIPEYDLDIENAEVYQKSNPENRQSIHSVIMGTVDFYRSVHNPDTTILVAKGHFNHDCGPTLAEQGAVFCELDVDTETGKLMNVKMTHCQDVGRAIYRRAVEGVFLGIHHSVESYTYAEKITDMKTGKVLNDNYIDHQIATIKDYHVQPVIIENLDPVSDFNHCGIGQANQNSNGAAIANAIYNAVGVRLKESPFTPDKVLKALGKI